MKIPTKLLVWCTFMVVEIILLKLGFWQYARYIEKNQQLILYQSAQNLPTLTSFANVTVENLTFYRKIAVSGQWLTDYSFYVAHKINHKRLGFWVYTPLKVGPHTILVQHGWVSVADHDVNQPAQVEITSLPHQWIGEIIPPPRSQTPTQLTKIG
ncbi:MAG: SURF1 family cytochrome oxidase biogenesis protein, partial [Gammaproteobacteria bacterium]|nr:SURF1 family cytochrome oxidase biogenesis protein [Gammaproteobacteria bacterium]